MNNSIAVHMANDFLTKFTRVGTECFDELDDQNKLSIANSLEPGTVAKLLNRISPESALKILSQSLSTDQIVKCCDPADIARIISRASTEEKNNLLNKLSTVYKEEIIQILQYPRDTAGFIMKTQINLFHPDDTVKDAVTKLRAKKSENINSVFIVNVEGVLQGSVSIQDLFSADDQTRIGEITKETPWVTEMSPRSEVVEVAEKYSAPALPVLNGKNVVLGVIRYATLLEMAQKDGLDGLQTMVGVSRDEKALTRPLFSVRKRLPWLTINLVTTFLAAFVVGIFEDTIAKITALAVLLPVVAGQSGNTGAQSQAVTMRGLALREIRLSHKWQVIFKETKVGLYNGLIIGLLCAISVFIWSTNISLAMVIGGSMILAMVAASISGAAIPILLTALDQDPATSSSIILTTVTDIVGFLSFLGLATIFMKYLL